jgi:hypothetical protein
VIRTSNGYQFSDPASKLKQRTVVSTVAAALMSVEIAIIVR